MGEVKEPKARCLYLRTRGVIAGRQVLRVYFDQRPSSIDMSSTDVVRCAMEDNFKCSESQSTTLSCSAHSVYVAVWPDTSEERSVNGVASPKRTRSVIAIAPLLKDPHSAGSFGAITSTPLLTSLKEARSAGDF